MESDKKFLTNQKVGGYGIANLLNNNTFITKKNHIVNLSFKLKNLIVYEDTEIMLLEFFNGIIVRVMKYDNDDSQPVATFDLVNDETKEILMKADKEYIGGLGIADIFFRMKYITQWEIPVLTKLCRGFVLGDVDVIKLLIKDYHLRISKESEWYLKNTLGLDL